MSVGCTKEGFAKMNRIPPKKKENEETVTDKKKMGHTFFLEERELAGGFLQCLPEGHQGLYVFAGFVEAVDH